MIAMRALKTFRGRPEEGIAGKVRLGREFRTGNDRRAADLERAGLAVRLVTPPEHPLSQLVNEASLRGPLSIAGGEIGEARPPLSSPADQVQQTPISDQRTGERESSALTNPGGSRRSRTRSTDATGPGGSSVGQGRSLLD